MDFQIYGENVAQDLPGRLLLSLAHRAMAARGGTSEQEAPCFDSHLCKGA